MGCPRPQPAPAQCIPTRRLSQNGLASVPRADLTGGRQLCPRRAAALAADKIVAFTRSDVVLQEPHTQTDAHQYAGQRCRTTEVDGRNGGMAMDFRSKHFKTDTFPQCRRCAVFRKRFDKYQQRADGIVAAEQRQKHLAKPRTSLRQIPPRLLPDWTEC